MTSAAETTRPGVPGCRPAGQPVRPVAARRSLRKWPERSPDRHARRSSATPAPPCRASTPPATQRGGSRPYRSRPFRRRDRGRPRQCVSTGSPPPLLQAPRAGCENGGVRRDRGRLSVRRRSPAWGCQEALPRCRSAGAYHRELPESPLSHVPEIHLREQPIDHALPLATVGDSLERREQIEHRDGVDCGSNPKSCGR